MYRLLAGHLKKERGLLLYMENMRKPGLALSETSFGGVEKRQHARQAYSSLIKFCFSPDSRDKERIGSGVNISESGMCLYTFSPVTEGESVEIRNALPVPHNRATVRRVETYTKDIYKVALKFIQ